MSGVDSQFGRMLSSTCSLYFGRLGAFGGGCCCCCCCCCCCSRSAAGGVGSEVEGSTDVTKRGRSISGRSGGASCRLHVRGRAGELCASASSSPDDGEEKDGERKKTQRAAMQKRRSLAARGRPRRAREDQAQDGAGDAKRAGKGAFILRLERGDERKPMETGKSRGRESSDRRHKERKPRSKKCV